MNLLLVFKILLVTIVIFFIFYCVLYKKNIEKFEGSSAPTLKVDTYECQSIDNTYFAEFDNEIQGCLNFITLEMDDATEKELFTFDGEKSYIYVQDYFDNYFNISFNIKFDAAILDSAGDQDDFVIMNTNFFRILVRGSKLFINNKRAISKQTVNFDKQINSDKFYFVKVEQIKKTKKMKVYFGELNKKIDEKEFDNNTDICNFEKGNQIHIGCLVTPINSREETLKPIKDSSDTKYAFSHFFKGSISNIKINFDKSMFNRIKQTPDLVIPCDKTELEEMDLSDSSDVKVSELQNYIEITCDITLFNQLRRKYMITSTANEDVDILQENSSKVINNVFFNNMKPIDEIFTNFKTVVLQKNSLIFQEAYNNFNSDEPSSKNTYHLFDYRKDENKKIVEKMKFLDQTFIKERSKDFDKIFIFIFGTKETNYNFLKCQKPVFIIVYRNDSKNIFQFEQIPINLQSFYLFHKNFNEYRIENPGIDNAHKNFFETFIPDESSVFEKNFYRLYDNTIDLGNITAKIFVNKILDRTEIVRFKQNERVNCGYVPYGETIFDCVEYCSDENQKSCSRNECRQRCKECTNSINCKWTQIQANLKTKFLPSKIKLRGFIGDKSVKLSWIKPSSPYEIEKYYIMVTSTIMKNKFDLYYYKGSEDLVEFYLRELNNDEPVSIYVFSKNKAGISEPSNKVTLIPNKNSVLNMQNVSNNSFSNSLQNYYKTSEESDIIGNNQKQIDQMEMLQELNELKEILIEKISFDKQN